MKKIFITLAVIIPLLSACGGTSATKDTPTEMSEADVKKMQLEVKAELDKALKTAEAEPDKFKSKVAQADSYYDSAMGAANEDDYKAAIDKATGLYKEAIQIDPKNKEGYMALAALYYDLGKTTETETTLQDALKADAKNAEAHYMLGLNEVLKVNMKEGATDADKKAAGEKAKKSFETAAQIKPELGEAYIGISNINLEEKDYKKALENAQTGLKRMSTKDDPFALWALAQAECLSGDTAAGRTTLAKVTKFGEEADDKEFVATVKEFQDKSCK